MRELTKRFLRLNSHVPRHARLALWVRHEARVHSSFHLLARLGKGGLCSRVVFLHEFEYNHVADGGFDGFWAVTEDGRHTGCYGLDTTNDDLLMVRLMWTTNRVI